MAPVTNEINIDLGDHAVRTVQKKLVRDFYLLLYRKSVY